MHRDDPSAFLFTLVNTSGVPPRKLKVLAGREKYALFCGPQHSVAFGGGHDLIVTESAYITNGSYSIVGNTYELPPGQNGCTFLAGQVNFQLADMEVYAVE